MANRTGDALRLSHDGGRTRLYRAIAAVCVLVAILGAQLPAPTSPAAAQGPPVRLHGHLPASGGVSLLVWDGGLALALIDEAERAGCSVTSLFVNRPGREGGLIGYIPRAPVAAVNRPFLEAFPGGQLESMPVLLECRPHIEGVVVDAAGEPLEGVRITAYHEYPLQHKQYRTHTATDGSFDLVVDRGAYRLSAFVEPPAGSEGGGTRGWYADDGLAADVWDATVVTVRTVGVTGLSIPIRSSFVISGVVLNSDGSPHPGIEVAAERKSGWGLTGRYTTDDEGRFALEVVGSEPVTVSLFRQTRWNKTWQQTGWYGPDGYTTISRNARSVVPGTPEASDVTIVLPVFRTVAGIIIGPKGEGRSDVFVRAKLDDVRLASFARGGHFWFSMPEGPVLLAFDTSVLTGRGWAVRRIGWYGAEGITTALSQATRVDLRAGDVDDIRFWLRHIWRITGRILQPDTDSPRPVTLRLLSYASGQPEPVTGVLAREDGRFELPAIGGDYALEVVVHDGRDSTVIGSYDPVSRVLSACGRPTSFRIEADARGWEITLTEAIIEGRGCP